MERRKKYKHIVTILCWFLVVFGCKVNNPKKSTNTTSVIQNEVKKTEKKKRIIYFNIDSLLVNKQISLYGNLDELSTIIQNQPDSIYKNIECGGFFDEEASINYYKNSCVEVTKKQYAFTKINLKDNLFLTYNNRFVLNSNLSKQDFLKEIQHSNIYEDEYFDELKKKGTEITVKACEECDSFWRFLFVNDKLLVVHLFTPC